MEEIDSAHYLQKEELFPLFAAQLQKDFESAGVHAPFENGLPKQFGALKAAMLAELQPLMRGSGLLLSSLLYRIDISEKQLQSYRQARPDLGFEEVIAELIIKRVLQKVILKKKFSQ